MWMVCLKIHKSITNIEPRWRNESVFRSMLSSIPGDPIVALSTAKKGVVVHHQACSNLTSSNAKDFIAAKWEETESAVNFDAEYTLKCLMNKMY